MIAFFALLTAAGLLLLALVETAFGLLMRLPQRLEAERESESDALSAYLEDPIKFFVPARVMRGALLVTLVVLLADPIGTGMPASLVLLAVSLSVAIIVGQVLPALMVRRSPERILEFLLPAFTAVANVLGPFTAMITGFMHAPASRTGGDGSRANETSAPTPQEAVEPADQNRLIRSAVDFGETLVREVMTPRPDIVAIRSDATIADLRRLVQEQEYSRLPVFTESLDNIVGLVVVKDLIQMAVVPADDRPVADVMRPAAFVPETKLVVDLLREFQQGRFQLALVVDEYGGTAGLVTVEDVVEELVGEIRDEYDSETELVVRDAGDAFVFSGKASTSELAEHLGVEIEDGEFETVGGFVLDRLGRVPVVGERFETDGLAIEILEAERRRIHKLRVRRAPPAPEVGP